MELLGPSSAAAPGNCNALTVHAEAAPTSFVLGGEYEVCVTTGDETVTVAATSLLSGDEFCVVLDAAKIAQLVPMGFAESATTVAGFYEFLLDAYGQEAGTMAVSDTLGVPFELTCVSREVVSAEPSTSRTQRTAAALKPGAQSSPLTPLSHDGKWGGRRDDWTGLLLGMFGAVDGRFGQVTAARGGKALVEAGGQAGPHDGSGQIKLRWLDDSTESDWIPSDLLQSVVGSRLALTETKALSRTFTTTITIPTSGKYTADLRVQLNIPLKAQASAEVRHETGFRTLCREVKRLDSQCTRLTTVVKGLQEQLQSVQRKQMGHVWERVDVYDEEAFDVSFEYCVEVCTHRNCRGNPRDPPASVVDQYPNDYHAQHQETLAKCNHSNDLLLLHAVMVRPGLLEFASRFSSHWTQPARQLLMANRSLLHPQSPLSFELLGNLGNSTVLDTDFNMDVLKGWLANGADTINVPNACGHMLVRKIMRRHIISEA